MKKMNGKLIAVLILAGAVFLARGWVSNPPPPTPAEELPLEQTTAEMVRVLDGDSLIVRYPSGQNVEVRIQGIDAPERHQPYSQQSRRQLRSALRGEKIAVIPRSRDRYDRLIAKLMIGDRDVGLELIEDGLAWHFRRFADEQPAEERRQYSTTESKARQEQKGLWAQPDPTPPWEYRRR